jgi:hypothetical protein
MRRGLILLEMLLVALAAHGLGAEGLDPWRGWIVFKNFAREAAESPDPGVSVQVSSDHAEATTSLIFLRQVVEQSSARLDPVGGVVCEFTFAHTSRVPGDWEGWSIDTASFDQFVDLVEASPSFQELVVREPIRSAVYWLEA